MHSHLPPACNLPSLLVSDPEHRRYGEHLSDEDVNELIRPADETLDLVHEWLFANGINELNYSPAGDWINVYLPVEQAERLLDTEYSIYRHEDGTTLVRTEKWALPQHLHGLIDTIQPTTSFLRSKPQANEYAQIDARNSPPAYTPPSNETIAKVCNLSLVTLDCFRTLYSFLNYEQKATGVNHIGFNNYLNQTPIRPDIYGFLKLYNPKAAESAYTFNSVEIAGGPAAQNTSLTVAELNSDQDISHEAVLDAETILGLTYPQNVTSFSTGGMPPYHPDLVTPTDTNEPYLTWIDYVLGQKHLPQVISSSYGDDEQSVPKAYAERVCKGFAQLGARGISLLVGSGDSGLGDQDGTSCFSNDGKNRSTFLPAFPASCPYVTTVGATQQFEPEVSAHRLPGLGFDGQNHSFFASGSGFSNYFPRPAYQDEVVPAYLKSLPKDLYKGLYNASKFLQVASLLTK
jgi:tripeptidyl-peptidase I